MHAFLSSLCHYVIPVYVVLGQELRKPVACNLTDKWLRQTIFQNMDQLII